MSFTGHVQNGQVIFDGPSIPADGAVVCVEVIVPPSTPVQKPKSLLEHYQDAIGKDVDLPADGSLNIDHYLYGLPKR